MTGAQIQPAGDGRYALVGELTFDTVPGVAERGASLFHESSVTVDLSQVHRADSAGLALLVEWMREADRRGARLMFANMPVQMLAIARVSSLDGILPLCRD